MAVMEQIQKGGGVVRSRVRTYILVTACVVILAMTIAVLLIGAVNDWYTPRWLVLALLGSMVATAVYILADTVIDTVIDTKREGRRS